MKIPLPICILSILTAVGTTWFLRTREMNFFPPAGYVAGDKKAEPILAEKTEPKTHGAPPPLLVDPVLLEPPVTLPALSYYNQLTENPELLSRVFHVLNSHHHSSLALFAGERLLESPTITPTQKRALIQKISYPQETRWCYDEREVVTLTITFSSADLSEVLKTSITTELSEIISTSSAGMVELDCQFRDGEPATLLTIGDIPLGAPLTSPTESIPNIISALYETISSHLSDTYDDLSLASFSDATVHEFEVGITRYSWAKLCAETQTP